MRKPVVITGAVSGWPALRRWRDPRYLRTLAGHRTIPVEVGRDYRRASWRQRLMLLRHFQEQHMGEAGAAAVRRGAVAYMAQHDLIEQVPALLADIATPDYTTLAS
jgi:hypothetical protein